MSPGIEFFKGETDGEVVNIFRRVDVLDRGHGLAEHDGGGLGVFRSYG